MFVPATMNSYKIYRNANLLLNLFLVIFQSCNLEPQTANTPATTANIAFDLPDLAVVVETQYGEMQLEAYKSTVNDKIIANENSSQSISNLLWVSLGNPEFIKSQEPNSGLESGKLFHFSNSGFYTYVQMLTEKHREILVDAVMEKYNIAVKPSQILNLILSRFDCTLTLYENGNKFLIKGSVKNFRNFPLRIDFAAPNGSKERSLSNEAVKSEPSNLEFSCNLASSGKEMRVNSLTISTETTENLQLSDKVFGKSFSKDEGNVFVTRDQVNLLASEIYSSLNVVEEYEMPQFEFNSAFLDVFTKQIASSQFSQVPFITALESLSKYGFDFSNDLKPDEIKSDLGAIYKLEKNKDKTKIVVDENHLETLKDENKWNFENGGKAGIEGIGSIGSSIKLARDKSSDWTQSNASISDQLSDLNRHSESDMSWEIQGNKIIPKSLNVCKLMQGQFNKTITFNRVRKQSYDAPFNAQLSIYTYRPKITDTSMQGMKVELEKLKTSASNTITNIFKLTQLINSIKTNGTAQQKILNDLDIKLVDYEKIRKAATTALNQALQAKNAGVKSCRICMHVESEVREYDMAPNYCSEWIDVGSRKDRVDVFDNNAASGVMTIRVDCRS